MKTEIVREQGKREQEQDGAHIHQTKRDRPGEGELGGKVAREGWSALTSGKDRDSERSR